MKIFHVKVPNIVYQIIKIEAENSEEAFLKVRKGYGYCLTAPGDEKVDSLPVGLWSIVEINNEENSINDGVKES